MNLKNLHNILSEFRSNFPDNIEILVSHPYSGEYLTIIDQYFNQHSEKLVFVTKKLDSGVQLGRWKNKETGTLYDVVRIVTNCTNAQNDQLMVEYQPYEYIGDKIPTYVRETNEFLEKFEKVN